MSLSDYVPLGRSGLLVSPMALGTMTFAAARWGTDEAASGAVLDAYLAEGGNHVDTADVYAGGECERMLGGLLHARGIREDVVLATKAGFGAGRGPHRGGNGRKHVTAAVEGSLGRLGTDRIDLFWLHVWDGITPAEEIVETMATLVRSGKVLHWGLSNVPAWLAAQCAALAPKGAGPVALQLFASLTSREPEREHVPLARDAGLGLVAWSPLSYGLLTGKYDRAAVEAGAPRAAGLPNQAGRAATDESRQRLDGANPFGDSLFTERNWSIVDALRGVAAEAGAPMASVALAWLLGRPGGWMPLLGASRPEQVRDNAGALSLALDPAHRARLDAASAPEGGLYALFDGPLRSGAVFGGASVRGRA